MRHQAENTLPPSTGLPGLDTLLDGLRLGDNVVLQVERIEDYQPFVDAYVQQAIREKRKLVYFRFAREPELLPEHESVQRVEVNPEIGFEGFVSHLVDVIRDCGPEAFYVFDCLSELAADWFSDRMLANFFMIVCPYLYRLDTIAYFALVKKRHSVTAIEGIHGTAQVIIDVFRHKDVLFVQPSKADGRYTPLMFTLHEWKGDSFEPVNSSAVVSEVLIHKPQPWLEFSLSRPGIWQAYFLQAQQVLQDEAAGIATPAESAACFERLMRMAVTRDQRFHDLVKCYMTLEDLIRVLGRMVGTGLIGGKALGMLLARAMLRKDCAAASRVLESHDSFFIGSDVFYTHLVRNDCWWLRRGKSLEERLEKAEEAQKRVLAGEFPQSVKQQFAEMLAYFGQSPLIVRSSSLLEDNYGNAFSGKYDSVFCANQGQPAERLSAFLDAVRQVYASSLSRDALLYRARSGLLDQDEQMAVLVQRVSGRSFGDYVAPHAGGVGFSFNAYAWHPDIDPEAGMLRLVVGLGTRAVDRTDDDYATLVALNVPDVRPQAVQEDKRRYSQRKIDVIDLAENALQSIAFEKLVNDASGFPIPEVAELDRATLDRARRAGIKNSSSAWIPNLAPVLNRPDFVPTMRAMLGTLERAYGTPVDVEFTINLQGETGFSINLVQCRPFQIRIKKANDLTSYACVPANAEVRLRTQGPIIGPGLAMEIDLAIYVVPSAYSRLSMHDRYAVARLIGRLTRMTDFADDTSILLIGPGRWGTSTPALGIPTTFGEIENVSAIVEVAVMHEGLVPDVSLGTHFFNDLVELDMLYMAVLPSNDGHCIDQDYFEKDSANLLCTLLPDATAFAPVVRVIRKRDATSAIRIFADTRKQEATCYTVPSAL